MENRYKIKVEGIPLEKLELSNKLEEEIKERGLQTIDEVFSNMGTVPDQWKEYLKGYSINYDDLYTKAKSFLNPERIAELQPITKEYKMGVLPPEKKN